VSLSNRPFDLFDFDASTGSLSNYINLGMVRGQYGVSFSPDNSKLYVTTDGRPEPQIYPHPDIILQYDISSGDPGRIVASRKSVIRDNPLTNIPSNGTFEGFSFVEIGLQLGIDGRLYAVSNGSYNKDAEGGIMVIIEKPNEAGINCQINYHRFDFGGGKVGVGLPNFIQSYFGGIESASTCAEPASVSVYPNPSMNTLTIETIEGCLPNARLQIINTIGQHVSTLVLKDREVEVDISHLSPGLYFFILSSVYNKRVVKKIVKL
jgi:hypothetical protein